MIILNCKRDVSAFLPTSFEYPRLQKSTLCVVISRAAFHYIQKVMKDAITFSMLIVLLSFCFVFFLFLCNFFLRFHAGALLRKEKKYIFSIGKTTVLEHPYLRTFLFSLIYSAIKL